MCGISGVVFRNRGGAVDTIESMIEVTHHRGPDARGSFADRIDETTTIALGHNRLCIVDLSDHAAQPMISRDGRYVLVYNGEVYNYKELAQELDPVERPSGDFGDTAIVLAALIKWGPKALERFNGMWAFLLYDKEEKTLLISRDRFGVKPLYFYDNGEAVFFASEIKSILAATGARLSINPVAAVPYLTRGLLNFSDQTFFAGVDQFAPASYQKIDLKRRGPFSHEPQRFWWHPFERAFDGASGVVTPEEVRAVFLDAIRLRLRSDVPIGLLLSGGVDSSSILGGIAALHHASEVTVFSVISDDPRSTEEPFIDRMCAYVGLTPHKVNVSREPLGLLARLAEANWFNDEPVCGASDIAYLRLMEAARELGIKVLLSGQGADEQLGGYNKFFYFYLADLARRGRLFEAFKTLVQSARRSETLYEFRISEAIRYLGAKHLSADTFIAPAVQKCDNVDIGFGGSYARREWIDLTKTSVPALLHYEDRMSMSRSLEVRVPFLDYRLVELLARVPPSSKFEGGWSKAIFRKAIEGLVPPEIQYRRDKKGFNVPEDVWMKREFRASTLAMFEAPMMAEQLGIIDRHRLFAMYQKFLNGSGILNGRHFFRVCIFETFLRRYEANISEAAGLAA